MPLHARLQFEPVVAEGFEALVVLRSAALRESLERPGIFSAERSRERLGSNFRPEFMRHIVHNGARVGLLTYQRNGFEKVGEAEIDVSCVWRVPVEVGA